MSTCRFDKVTDLGERPAVGQCPELKVRAKILLSELFFFTTKTILTVLPECAMHRCVDFFQL